MIFNTSDYYDQRICSICNNQVIEQGRMIIKGDCRTCSERVMRFSNFEFKKDIKDETKPNDNL